jgi:hypothetical protein
LLLHPTSMFGLLVVGVLLTGMTYRTLAQSYDVSATVPADPLTSAATIDSPADGQVFAGAASTVVRGTCPDESYVKLYRNGMFSGVAICADQAYDITTDLFEGRNTLKVQAFNMTDQAGPSTPTIDVTYHTATPSAPAASGRTTPADDIQFVPPASKADGVTAPTASPLVLWSDYGFNVTTTGGEFKWTLCYLFGKAPYATTIDWGDSSQSHQSVPNHEDFMIRHTYTASGYYKINVDGTDADGRTVSIQLAALVKKPGARGTIGSIINESSGPTAPAPGSSFSWLLLAWPTYVVISVMAISFMLGERREYLRMTHRPKRAKHA